MTRLSDALKRAAESADAPVSIQSNAATATSWQFAPTEPVEAPSEPPTAAPHTPPAADVQAARTTVPPQPRSKPRNVTIRVGQEDRHKLVINEGLDPALVEQFRHLAATLHHAQEQSAMRSVMVTSAAPNEGKTLTATNLALTLSESYQRRVLLIDADLRRPRMREMFALPAGEGLTNVLVKPDGGRLPVHHVSQTLAVLTAGDDVADPMSLLASPAMKQLLDEARSLFDWVVVDTPPIAILPDANLLSAMIDTALLVVSAQSTPYPLVQRAVQAIGPGRILGVVLNRAEHAAVPIYDYGYPGKAATARSTPRRWWRRLRDARRTSSTATALTSAAERSLG
jgi:capsular exopolysaccharide synthesis family protein